MYENKNTIPEQNLLAAPYDETVDQLAKYYFDPQAPDRQAELMQLSLIDEERRENWKNDGFDMVGSFLSPDGELISIAEFLQDDTPDSFEEVQADQTWRVAFADEVRDVVIPKQFTGKSMSFRSSHSQSIFNLKNNQNMNDEDINWMRDHFGDHLLLLSEEQKLVSDKFSDGLVGVGSIIDRQEEIIRTNHAEALEIESTAQQTRGRIKKRLFESAKSLIQRQDEAYKTSMRSK